jgi:hypothetical protein
LCYSDKHDLRGGGAEVGPFSLIGDALRTVLASIQHSRCLERLPATADGWATVASLIGRPRTAVLSAEPPTVREVLPHGALVPAGYGELAAVPAEFRRRTIVFFGDKPGEGLVSLDIQARAAPLAFPFGVVTVEDTLVVLWHPQDRALCVLSGDRELIGTFASLHDALWLLLGRRAEEASQASAPPTHLRPVLDSLANGSTDQAAQRALALSSRTFSRRASELLDLLGARSRFQAGAEASRRRWV